MTPRTRFRLWTVDVVALVVATHVSVATRVWPVVLALMVAGLCLAMAALILTTPPDAIRLPKWRSVVILTLLTAALFGHAAVCLPRVREAPFGTAGAVLTASAFAAVSVRRRFTPWWVAPLWWNPLMVGPFALSPVMVALLGVGFTAFAWTRKSAVH